MVRAPVGMTPLRPIDRWFIDEILPHEQRFLKVARRLTRSQDEAVDLLQNAYCRLFESSGWASALDPRAYAIRTIRNLALSSMRRARIVEFRQLVEIDGLDTPDDQPDPFHVAAGRQALERASTALAAMPERCSSVLLRCRVEDQSPSAVAAAMGLSVSTLEKRLARGLKLLAAAIYPQEDAVLDQAAPARNQAAGQENGLAAYDRRHVSRAADR